MKKTAVILLIIFCLCAFCACGGNKFAAEDIKEINYYSFYNGKTEQATLTRAEDFELFEKIYDSLIGIDYDKKRSKKDFWTQKEITYSAPTSYFSVNVVIDGGKGMSFYVYDGMVIKSFSDYEYSTTGVNIPTEIQLYLMRKDAITE